MSVQTKRDFRQSRNVKTPLLIAAGVIGLPLAIGLVQYWSTDDAEDEPAGAPPTPPAAVNPDTVYPMNHFVPGVGYYHVPYHTWFPFPYNHYEATRGWYRGGHWRTTAEEDESERKNAAASGFVAGRGGSRGTGSPGSPASSRPFPTLMRANAGAGADSAAHAPASSHVIRGGFGFSAHPSVS